MDGTHILSGELVDRFFSRIDMRILSQLTVSLFKSQPEERICEYASDIDRFDKTAHLVKGRSVRRTLSIVCP